MMETQQSIANNNTNHTVKLKSGKSYQFKNLYARKWIEILEVIFSNISTPISEFEKVRSTVSYIGGSALR